MVSNVDALSQCSQDNDALTLLRPVHWTGSDSASCLPSTATIQPFMHNHLSVESKIWLCSSIGGECGVIGVLLLRPITSHHFIFMRERLDIKFPCTGLSISPVISPSQSCCSELPCFPHIGVLMEENWLENPPGDRTAGSPSAKPFTHLASYEPQGKHHSYNFWSCSLTWDKV